MKKPAFRTDFYIVLGVLLLIALAFFLRAGAKNAARGARVDIYLNNALYRSVPLPKEGETHISVEQQGGEKNDLLISREGVYMHDANCMNQDCVHQGRVGEDNFESRPLGRWIICLPHKLAVEYIPDE